MSTPDERSVQLHRLIAVVNPIWHWIPSGHSIAAYGRRSKVVNQAAADSDEFLAWVLHIPDLPLMGYIEVAEGMEPSCKVGRSPTGSSVKIRRPYDEYLEGDDVHFARLYDRDFSDVLSAIQRKWSLPPPPVLEIPAPEDLEAWT